MGIQAAFLAWLPWEAKAPFLIGPCAWAGRCLGSKVLLQQQVTLLGSHRGLVVAGGPPAFQGTWTSCCGIEGCGGGRLALAANRGYGVACVARAKDTVLRVQVEASPGPESEQMNPQ